MQALTIAGRHEYLCAATQKRLNHPYRILPCLCVVNLDAITTVGQTALEKLPAVCPNRCCQKPVENVFPDNPKSISAKLFYEALDKDDMYPEGFPFAGEGNNKIPGPRSKFVDEILSSHCIKMN